MVYEHRREPLLPLHVFVKRLAACAALALGIMAFSLGIGTVGYHHLAGLTWVDAIYNASMILGGMGPVAELHSDGAKLFASAYALYSGLVLIATIGLALSPLIHRFLHRFHLDEEDIPHDAGASPAGQPAKRDEARQQARPQAGPHGGAH